MNAHTKQEFDSFMNQLIETNANLKFYTDFEKCHANVAKIAIKLTQLNYLVGKDNIERAVNDLWEENPKVFSVLGVLIAVRDRDKKKVLENNQTPRLIKSYFTSPEGVVEYLNGTGLAEVLRKKQVTNLVDYVFGVEVGLDSNARKNRSGHIMEDLVAGIFTQSDIPWQREVSCKKFAAIEKALGKDIKRFDFVVETPSKTYLIEVNFYSGGGTKLNEVARAYTELAPKVNACQGFEFIWITDGIGWHSARNKLEEAFYAIPGIYNLSTLNVLIDKMKKSL